MPPAKQSKERRRKSHRNRNKTNKHERKKRNNAHILRVTGSTMAGGQAVRRRLTSQAWHQSQTDSDLLHHIPPSSFRLLSCTTKHRQTDRQANKERDTERDRERNSGGKRQEARATERGSAEQCSATAATVLSKESREKRANANYANTGYVNYANSNYVNQVQRERFSQRAREIARFLYMVQLGSNNNKLKFQSFRWLDIHIAEKLY